MFKLFIGSLFISLSSINHGFGINISKTKKLIIITSISTFISGLINYLINRVLIDNNLVILKNILFIIVILLVSLGLFKLYNVIFKKDDIEYNDIVLNSIILGISILGINTDYNLVDSLIYLVSLTSSFIILSFLIYYLNKELENRCVLRAFKGIPIILICLGILSIILGRF
jgi:electron transport complex protein RnfA